MSSRLLIVLLGLSALPKDGAPNALWAQGAYPQVVNPSGLFYRGPVPGGLIPAQYQAQYQYGQPHPGGPGPYNPNFGNPNFGANLNFRIPNLPGPGLGFGGGYYFGTPPFSAFSYSQLQARF
ncbi:MAG: hypothetical protein JWM11_1450, partial [Planctomycetaceae bacterium]|nr:hypothetical protein [Planctomycetaceae bacterium]